VDQVGISGPGEGNQAHRERREGGERRRERDHSNSSFSYDWIYAASKNGEEPKMSSLTGRKGRRRKEEKGGGRRRRRATVRVKERR
jgi:hypothetical protein